MTFNEIAETMTPTGTAAAVIGLVLCAAVMMIRYRARNLEELRIRERMMAAVAERDKEAKSGGPVTADPAGPAPTPHSAFKTFKPE